MSKKNSTSETDPREEVFEADPEILEKKAALAEKFPKLPDFEEVFNLLFEEKISIEKKKAAHKEPKEEFFLGDFFMD